MSESARLKVKSLEEFQRACIFFINTARWYRAATSLEPISGLEFLDKTGAVIELTDGLAKRIWEASIHSAGSTKDTRTDFEAYECGECGDNQFAAMASRSSVPPAAFWYTIFGVCKACKTFQQICDFPPTESCELSFDIKEFSFLSDLHRQQFVRVLGPEYRLTCGVWYHPMCFQSTVDRLQKPKEEHFLKTFQFEHKAFGQISFGLTESGSTGVEFLQMYTYRFLNADDIITSDKQ